MGGSQARAAKMEVRCVTYLTTQTSSGFYFELLVGDGWNMDHALILLEEKMDFVKKFNPNISLIYKVHQGENLQHLNTGFAGGRGGLGCKRNSSKFQTCDSKLDMGVGPNFLNRLTGKNNLE